MMVPHHVADLQIFVIDHIELAHRCQCDLVVEVLPLSAHRLMRFREQFHRLAASVTPLLATGDTALEAFQVPLGFAITGWREDALTVCQRRKCFDAQVYARLLPGWF